MTDRMDAVKRSKELKLTNNEGKGVDANNKSTRTQEERDRPMTQALKEARDKYKGEKILTNSTIKTNV